MNLKTKIEHDLKRHEIMACYDLENQLASIDFVALMGVQANENESGYNVDNGTATINVRGVLVPNTGQDYSEYGVTGYDQLNKYLSRANDDPFVKNIMLDIDSVGGYVKGLSDVVEKIDSLSKPIESFVSGNAYSGAYWLASSTDTITANKDSGIGSIGVKTQHYEQSEMLKKEGVKVTMFSSGFWKDAFNPFRALSQRESDRIQERIDESASVFFNHVAYHRGMDATAVADLQGDTFSATKAKELGLIDEIVGQSKAIPNTNLTKAESSASNPVLPNPVLPQAILPNSILTTEAYMNELEQAKAQVSTLTEQVTQKDTALASKDLKIADLEKQLATAQTAQRQKDIDSLAEATGKEFTTEQVAEFKAMTDGQFAMTAEFAKQSKPVLPAGLDKPQATGGAEPKSRDEIVMAEIEKAKQAKGGN